MIRPTSYPLLVLFAASLLFAAVHGKETEDKQQTSDPTVLTLERIFGKSDFGSKGFAGNWMPQGHSYTALEDSERTTGTKDIVRYDAATGERTIMVPGGLFIPNAESGPLKIEQYSFSKDESLVLVYTNSKRVWRTNSRGDYWVLDRSSRQLHQVAATAPPASTMFAKIAPTSDRVAYVRDGNIFVEDLASHEVQQITQKSSDKIINGTFDWVYEEEFGLRDGYRWSPDGRKIAYWQLDTTGVPVFTMINNTDAMYPQLIQFAHPKTGQRNAACRVGVASLESGETQWLAFEGDAKEHYIARMAWADSSDEIQLQRLNRLQNTNQILLSNVVTGETKTILTEADEAWVDVHDEMHWLENGAKFTWVSERSGWREAYLSTRTGSNLQRITPGGYDAISVLHVDEQRKCIYFIASPDDATERYLYKSMLDGSQTERVTPAELKGSNAYRISADGMYAIHTWSSSNDPPTTDMISLPDHQIVRSIEKNEKLVETIKELDRSPVEFFRVSIGDGLALDGWCIKPPNMKKNKKYPLLVYVYGEPAGSTVTNGWGGSSYLWHAMLAQRGYVVMSFDNRGTNTPRGRAWRKSIYRQVGIVAPRDQAAAIEQVIEDREYIDRERIGIWGWSGGGSMSLNAIFKFPDVYKMAISVAPVPNQRYYDTIYQERYMGLPRDNAQGYFDGSPINFAHQLKGNLLLVHGTGDDNCHYQTMEMLINELVLHNKPFSMMAYPNRTHSIREGKNTTLHLRTMMTKFIEDNL